MSVSALLLKLGVFALIISGCTSVLNGERFNTPTSMYQISNSTLPITLTWETKLQETILNPPVFTSSDILLAETSDTLYGLDISSGKVVWQHQLNGSTSKYSVDKFLISHKNHVFVANSAQTAIQSLDLQTGTLQWEVSLDKYVKAITNKPQAVQLIADNDKLYILVSLVRGTAVIALDIARGDLVWRSPPEIGEITPNAMYLSPSQSSTPYLVVQTVDVWWYLDTVSGKLWQTLNLGLSADTPTQYKGFLYTGGNNVLAVELATLGQIWEFKPECSNNRDRVIETPYVVDNAAYVMTTCGLFYKLDTLNGSVQWRTNQEAKLNSFTIFQNMGYLLNRNGSLNSVNLENGQVTGTLWAEPNTVPIGVYNAVVTNQEVLILSYGTQQLFAFKSK